MRKIKTFEFRGYKKCSLSVGLYNKEKAIAIAVIDMETDEEIETLTVLDVYADYEVGVATVIGDFIDGDEVTGYKTATDILKELGIVKEVVETYSIDEKGYGGETKVDVCDINLDRLEEYAKEWKYREFEEK